jgi:hypothetical protein
MFKDFKKNINNINLLLLVAILCLIFFCKNGLSLGRENFEDGYPWIPDDDIITSDGNLPCSETDKIRLIKMMVNSGKDKGGNETGQYSGKQRIGESIWGKRDCSGKDKNGPASCMQTVGTASGNKKKVKEALGYLNDYMKCQRKIQPTRNNSKYKLASMNEWPNDDPDNKLSIEDLRKRAKYYNLKNENGITLNENAIANISETDLRSLLIEEATKTHTIVQSAFDSVCDGGTCESVPKGESHYGCKKRTDPDHGRTSYHFQSYGGWPCDYYKCRNGGCSNLERRSKDTCGKMCVPDILNGVNTPNFGGAEGQGRTPAGGWRE